MTKTKVMLILLFLSISMISMITAPAPTAQTLPAQGVTQTSALLVGSVNPNGVATQVDFACCDPSAFPTYFPPTPLQHIGNGNSAVIVTQLLTGLTPGSTYKYAIRSTNAAGSQNGSCVSFTTLAAGIPSATLTTNKAVYSLGEVVVFTLTNTGAIPLVCNVNNPWSIYKRVGGSWQVVYVPAVMIQNWTLNSGNSKSWSWAQSSNAMVPIDEATYKVEVSISGVGTWSTQFDIGGAGGLGSLKIECNTSGYSVFIDGVFKATATTTSVTIHNLTEGVHEAKLTKSGCQDVTETVVIISGMTTTFSVSMSCGGEEEKDDDNDGIPNSKDSCYNPGCTVVDSKGCPRDTDGDGTSDCEDSCPTERGDAANKGCPPGSKDKDGDGVSDDTDACYNPDCTIVDSQGCPKDTDGDGLDDCKDECPSDYGERKDKGCPTKDADSDGVPDDQDSCYNPGCTRVDARGCPYDSDGDGLNDCEDNCPTESGPRSNNGCPQQGFCMGSLLLTLFVLMGVSMRRH